MCGTCHLKIEDEVDKEYKVEKYTTGNTDNILIIILIIFAVVVVGLFIRYKM